MRRLVWLSSEAATGLASDALEQSRVARVRVLIA